MRKRRQKLLYEVTSEIQKRIVSNAINPSKLDDVVDLEANPIKELIGRLAVDQDLKPLKSMLWTTRQSEIGQRFGGSKSVKIVVHHDMDCSIYRISIYRFKGKFPVGEFSNNTDSSVTLDIIGSYRCRLSHYLL